MTDETQPPQDPRVPLPGARPAGPPADGQPADEQPAPPPPAWGPAPVPPPWAALPAPPGAEQQPRWGQYAPPPSSPYGMPLPGGYVPPPKPGVIPLRPLGLGEILDGAFQAARRNGKAMFGSALIFQAIASVAMGLILVFVLRSGTFADLEAGTISRQQAAGLAAGMGGTILVTVFLQTIVQMILQGALVVPVLRAILGRHTAFALMWRLARPRIASLVLLALLYVGVEIAAIALLVALAWLLIATTGGVGIGVTVLLVLAYGAVTIWIATKILLAPAAVIAENLGVIAALRRSWTLTRRNWWRTFGINLLAAVISGVIAGVISMPISFLVSLISTMVNPNPTADQLTGQLILTQGVSAIISALVGALTLAFQAGVMALIYVDLRMRRDGFDIALLRESETPVDDGGLPGLAGSGTGPGAAGGAGVGPFRQPPHP